jgi:hypothetical protein
MTTPRRVPAVRFVPLLALLVSFAAGCASAPPAVETAQNLTVSYWDFRADLNMVLVNESNPAFADLYSAPRKDAAIKRAPDEQVRHVVDFAADHRFFDYATAAPADLTPTDEMRDNAYGMVTIDADGQRWAFVFERGMDQRVRGVAQDFTDITTEFRKVYDSVVSLQFIGSTKTDSRFFDREKERLQKENEKTLQKDSDR